MQGDVFWCNCLSFLDPGAISRHIACVTFGHRRKNIASPWSESVIFDGAIGNACCYIIVKVNGDQWLGVDDF